MIRSLAAVNRGDARDSAFDLVFIHNIGLAQTALRANDPGIVRDLYNKITAVLGSVIGEGQPRQRIVIVGIIDRANRGGRDGGRRGWCSAWPGSDAWNWRARGRSGFGGSRRIVGV